MINESEIENMFLLLVLQLEPFPSRSRPDIQNLSLQAAAIAQMEQYWTMLQGCQLQGTVQGTTDGHIMIRHRLTPG